LLFINRGERRKKRLFYLGALYFTALAALAKGAPGLVLPIVVAGAVLLARRDWLELTRVELAGFGLMFAAVCLPWYVQEFMRHGEPFTDRLLFHDMYDRAFVHVHDTNAGSDVSLRYYIWQLGYGLFPWTGLAPLGIGIALGRRHSGDAEGRRFRELAISMVLWLAIAFSLFTLSLTKFHHYALPCTPPLAVGAALVLDRALGERRLPDGWRLPAYLACLGAAALLLVYGALRLSDGTLFGRVLESGAPPEASPLRGCAFMTLGLLLTWFAARRWAPAAGQRDRDSALGVLAVTAALVTLLVARDLSTSLSSDVPGSARLLHLVTYNYKRSWPATLDFEAVQWGFGVAAALCLLLWLVPRFRLHATVLLSAVGVWFCAFTLWIYLPLLAPHYGQRELFLAYYQKRHGPEEPIVAYQMNWKGENFYSGNRLPAFVSTGAKFKKWLKTERRNGTKVIYFVTEHGRIGTLKSELGAGFNVMRLTDTRLNNKFALVRVELTNEPTQATDAAE
jgi:hypothetical protein